MNLNPQTIQAIVDKVESMIGDVADHDRLDDPAYTDVELREEYWTLAIDAAHDMNLADPTRYAKAAMGRMGYPYDDEPPEPKEEVKAVWPPRPYRGESARRVVDALLTEFTDGGDGGGPPSDFVTGVSAHNDGDDEGDWEGDWGFAFPDRETMRVALDLLSAEGRDGDIQEYGGGPNSHWAKTRNRDVTVAIAEILNQNGIDFEFNVDPE